MQDQPFPVQVVLGLYLLWFIVSLLAQWRPFARTRRHFDVLRVFLTWALFNQSVVVAQLFWRDQRLDHTLSEWEPVPMSPAPTWLSPIWHPELLRPHEVNSAVTVILRALKKDAIPSLHAIEQTLAYRVLWQQVLSLSRPAESAARQFKIVTSDTALASRPVYMSQLRSLTSD